MHRGFPTALVLALAACSAGCRTGGIPLLNYIPLSKPINIVIASDSPIESAPMLLSHERLREAMSKDLGRGVHLELAFPLLLEPGLSSNWQQLAILSPQQFATLSSPDKFTVLAVASAVSPNGAEPGVLITKAVGGAADVASLKGQRVAFGPPDSARLNAAARAFLRDAGVREEDLKREILPVPGSLLTFPDSASVGRAVLDGEAIAGFVNESYLQGLSETPAGADVAARSQFRILGRTMTLPDRIVVASPTLDAATRQRVQDFLVASSRDHARALQDAHLAGFTVPTDEVLQNLRALRTKTPVAQPVESDSQ
jgi:ABC-type phosphate/phosphonate transport system substrate-binding protein